jgi:hypothetical protein
MVNYWINVFYWTFGILYVIEESTIPKEKIIKEVFCLLVLFCLLIRWNALKLRGIEILFLIISLSCLVKSIIDLLLNIHFSRKENIILNIIVILQLFIIFLGSFIKALQIQPFLRMPRIPIFEKTIFQLGVLIVTAILTYNPLIYIIYTILLPHEWTIAYILVQAFNGFTKNMLWVLIWFTIDVIRTKCQNWCIL